MNFPKRTVTVSYKAAVLKDVLLKSEGVKYNMHDKPQISAKWPSINTIHLM